MNAGDPSAASGVRKPSGSYHHGDLPQALIDAAIELLAEGGPAALTLRGAARRAGVTSAAPYKHFADKEALMVAVAEQGFVALRAAVEAAVRSGPTDALERFRSHGLAYVRFALEHPGHYRVMFGPEVPDKRVHPPLLQASDGGLELLRTQIAECQQAGYIREGSVDEIAVLAWSVVHGVASLLIDRQIPEDLFPANERPEQLAEHALMAMFEGLGNPARQD